MININHVPLYACLDKRMYTGEIPPYTRSFITLIMSLLNNEHHYEVFLTRVSDVVATPT